MHVGDMFEHVAVDVTAAVYLLQVRRRRRRLNSITIRMTVINSIEPTATVTATITLEPGGEMF
jgi:hypothetical protein